MAPLFLRLYDLFRRRRAIFWPVFLGALTLITIGTTQIKLEEDITRFFPEDERVEKLQYVFQHAKFIERLVVMVSARDTTAIAQPDSLIVLAEELVSGIERDLKPFVKKITSRVDDEKILRIFTTVYDHLPVFLNEDDYGALDSLTTDANVGRVLTENYRQLISPSGIAMKKILVQDPLGISFLVLRKLQQLQYDENFELYDSYIVTKDHRHLLFFLEPVYPPSETGNNTAFIEALDEVVHQTADRHEQVTASYFGAAAVAVGNAVQLRRDSILTISAMVILLAVFLIGFFRKKRVPFLILIPVVFGGLFSLSCIYLLKGSVSILAIAAGSIILGIAVNYALHFLAHLKHTHDIKLVIKDLANPMTLGSATTVLAFFCLQFANAAVLRDVGLFAGFSLVGAALCSLVFLPQLVSEKLFMEQRDHESRLEKLMLISPSFEKVLVVSTLLLTPVFFYFARQVEFNSDMSKLNFMTSETRRAQEQLEHINKSSLSTAYVVASGGNLESALRKSELAYPELHRLKLEGKINKFTSPSTFLISDSLQRLRIARWNMFWTASRKAHVASSVRKAALALHFSEQVIGNFDSLITKQYRPADAAEMLPIRTAFFDDYIIERNNSATVITLANVKPAAKNDVYGQLEKTPVHAVDRQMLTNLFVEYINADFNFIVTFTAILVFAALFISYGRIELTLITFVPMFITWIWILGIMALLGIEFNIVNVMVSTFIFGLGDDYSIFIMDGLQQEYKTGKKNLPSIRTSIFLSAITTIAGLGVLIFAQHPALRSIASIAIIGIVCVFVMAQTVEPFLFRVLITNRTQKGFTPMTWAGILRTSATYIIFVSGAIFLTILGMILKLIPFWKKQTRFFFHALLSYLNRTLIYLGSNFKTTIVGRLPETYARARVIIANHTSFLDILLTTMLHPRLILVTNKWVWNSPVFGGVVRLADYYPVSEGAEDSIARLQKRVNEGYSVVVFPEGKRSEDTALKRFHKGAFYMAEEMKLPIQPLLIHGAQFGIPKGSFYLNDGRLTLKFLPPVEVDDNRFGITYAARTKAVSKYFKQEYEAFAQECETPEYFAYRLISNYLYKGPVLEWYLRIKLRLENNYGVFDKLLPRQGKILDLGCGYGFLCYMLQFLSADRVLMGVDYDEEKIEVAQHGYSRTERLQFRHADVTQFRLEQYDGIVVSDVLHYLTPQAQEVLLRQCFEALRPGGTLIIRDGNADLKERHKGTQLTEFFSVRLLKFNKAANALHFVSGEKIKQLAAAHGLHVKAMDDAKFTSNVIFVLQKP